MTTTLLADGNSGAGAGIAIIAILAIGAYFIPTIVAGSRHVPNVGSVFVLNLFLGWTFLGWVVSMSMAMRSRAQATIINVHGGNALLPAALPAGWYPDPHNVAAQRYWDGGGWTAHTA